jgi:hypothetical protein
MDPDLLKRSPGFSVPGDLLVHYFDLPVLLHGCYLLLKFKDH